MIDDPALRPPRRFTLLALALVLPALALAGLAGWALRLDRRAVVAETNARAQDVARAVVARLTNVLQAPDATLVREAARGNLPPLGTGPTLLILDERNRLAWPAPRPWPPVPQPLLEGRGEQEVNESGEDEALNGGVPSPRPSRAEAGAGEFAQRALSSGQRDRSRERRSTVARLLRAHGLAQAGETTLAAEAYQEAFELSSADDATESGLSVREVAAHAILDLAGGDIGRLPAAWRTADFPGVRALMDLPSTPVSEAAIDRIRPLLPELHARAAPPLPAASRWLEARLLRRDLTRQAFAALAEGRSHGGGNGNPVRSGEWADVMTFQLDRQVWLVLRQPLALEGGSDEPTGFVIERNPYRVFALFRWGELFEIARDAARTVDPRGLFGVSVSAAATGLSLAQEEPSGIAGRATAIVVAALPFGLALTVSAAPVDPAVFHAAQRRRERLFGGLALGAVGLSGVAAAVTWTMLVRQHRLGVHKSNFVSSVSHELRAPLASVRLLADNLEQDRVPDPVRRDTTLRLIGRECRRLGALVDNVLDLARIERHQKRIEREPTDVPALVRETTRLTALSGEERGIRIRVDVGEAAEGLVASVDGQALQQALTNLLDNALKHTPSGGEVVVSLDHAPDDRLFRMTVSDSGPGIPATERERVFEPFHRLGGELRRESPGIGIGLSIVRYLVEAHEGRVWVDAGTSSGATVVVELPVGLKDPAGEPSLDA